MIIWVLNIFVIFLWLMKLKMISTLLLKVNCYEFIEFRQIILISP